MVKGRIVKIDTPEALKAVAEEESVIAFSFNRMTSKVVEGLSERLSELKVVPFAHNRMRIYGGIPAHVFRMVLKYAKERGIEIDAVKSIKPSLEDAFVKITGLSPSIMMIEKEGRRQNVA